jgi:hypothetical protein
MTFAPRTIQYFYHFQRTNWENYYLEILMVAGILVYFLNFFSGKSKNQKVSFEFERFFNLSQRLMDEWI